MNYSTASGVGFYKLTIACEMGLMNLLRVTLLHEEKDLMR